MTQNEQFYIVELGKECGVKVRRVRTDAVTFKGLGDRMIVTSIFSLAESLIKSQPTEESRT